MRFILQLRLNQVCTKNEVGHISIAAKEFYKFTQITTAEGNINAAQQAGSLGSWLDWRLSYPSPVTSESISAALPINNASRMVLTMSSISTKNDKSWAKCTGRRKRCRKPGCAVRRDQQDTRTLVLLLHKNFSKLKSFSLCQTLAVVCQKLLNAIACYISHIHTYMTFYIYIYFQINRHWTVMKNTHLQVTSKLDSGKL